MVLFVIKYHIAMETALPTLVLTSLHSLDCDFLVLILYSLAVYETTRCHNPQDHSQTPTAIKTSYLIPHITLLVAFHLGNNQKSYKAGSCTKLNIQFEGPISINVILISVLNKTSKCLRLFSSFISAQSMCVCACVSRMLHLNVKCIVKLVTARIVIRTADAFLQDRFFSPVI